MRLGIGLLLLLTLMACSTTEQTPTASVATSTLIAPTLTLTPLPPTATPTESNLPAPQDLATASASGSGSFTRTPAPEGVEEAGLALVERDPIAAELVRLAQEEIRRATDLPTRRIQLEEIRSVVWTDSSLNCPLPDSSYVPLEIDGYRIVLSAGEQEYVFHTDIDRVMLCDVENEQLPGAEATEAVAGVVEEATEEPAS
ncbi:MAG: hypothetical protein IPK19_07925 [Chloroflexi bacterium]|nr:hypothetical protein [Chloroflexota bacterium]